MSVSYYNGNEVPEMNYNITVDAELQEKSVTLRKNGTTVISPDSNYNALSSVTVNVDIEAKADPILQSKTIDITENGNTIVSPDSGYDGLSEVSVNVTVASSGGSSDIIVYSDLSPREFLEKYNSGQIKFDKEVTNYWNDLEYKTTLAYTEEILCIPSKYGLWAQWYYDYDSGSYNIQKDINGNDLYTPALDTVTLDKLKNEGITINLGSWDAPTLKEYSGKPISTNTQIYKDDYTDFEGNTKTVCACTDVYRENYGNYEVKLFSGYDSYYLTNPATGMGYDSMAVLLKEGGYVEIGSNYSSEANSLFKTGYYGAVVHQNAFSSVTIEGDKCVVNMDSSKLQDNCFEFIIVKTSSGELYTPENIIFTASGYNCKGLREIYEFRGLSVFDNLENNKNLIKIGKITVSGDSLQDAFRGCSSLISLPQFDASNVKSMYGTFEGCASLHTIPVLNTENITRIEYCFEGCTSLKRIEGLSFKSMPSISSSSSFIFGISSNIPCRYILIKDIGTNSACTTLDCTYAKVWGIADDEVTDARQSLIDSLLTYSFDRATAGYSTCTIRLYSSVKAVLTADEIAQIQAKGYTIS